MKAPFRYSLLGSHGLWFYWTGSGLGVSPTPKYLEHDPVDWKDWRVTYERDITTFGVFRQFTLPSTWHGNSAKILRAIFLNDSYEAYTLMRIEKLNTTLWNYETFAEAEIDYSQFHSTFDDDAEPYTVKLNLMDNSISEFIKANETVTEEIELDGGIGALTITYDGIDMRNGCKWIVSDGLLDEGSTNRNPAGGHCLDASIVYIDGTNRRDVQEVRWQVSNLITDFISADKYIYKSTAARAITFEWNIIVNFGAVSGNNYSLGKSPVYVIQKWDGSTVTLLHTIHDFTGQSFLSNTFTLTGTYTTTAEVGAEYYISVFIQPTPLATEFVNFHYDPASWITLKYYDRLPSTTSKGFKFRDLADNLLKQQSDNRYSIESDFLYTANAQSNYDNEPINTIITPAESIKGKTDVKIKTSLANLRQFARAVWGAGTGIEGNKLRIEPLSYFFKKDEIIATIEKISGFKYSVARDMLYSSVKIGYDAQPYDGINGSDEFNVVQHYKLPVNRVSTTLDLVSPIRADIYGIEQLRGTQYATINEDIKDTAKTQLDSTLYAVEVNDSHNLRRWATYIAGVDAEDTAYNLGITPKRNYIRNLPQIYSILPDPNSLTDTIRMASTMSDGSLVSQLAPTGKLIAENDNLYIAGSAFATDALYRPIYFEFTTETPENLFAAILANPYGVIRFKVHHRHELRGGNHYLKGFIVSVEACPKGTDAYTWKLLSTPDNDLTVFIDT